MAQFPIYTDVETPQTLLGQETFELLIAAGWNPETAHEDNPYLIVGQFVD